MYIIAVRPEEPRDKEFIPHANFRDGLAMLTVSDSAVALFMNRYGWNKSMDGELHQAAIS